MALEDFKSMLLSVAKFWGYRKDTKPDISDERTLIWLTSALCVARMQLAQMQAKSGKSSSEVDAQQQAASEPEDICMIHFATSGILH